MNFSSDRHSFLSLKPEGGDIAQEDGAHTARRWPVPGLLKPSTPSHTLLRQEHLSRGVWKTVGGAFPLNSASGTDHVMELHLC